MIQHMHEMLRRWATWCSSGGRVGGLGYGESTLAQFMPSRGTVHGGPILNEEALSVERAMRRLPDGLRDVVTLYYLGHGSVREKARAVGIAAGTLVDRVTDAQVRLERIICENESPAIRQVPRRRAL